MPTGVYKRTDYHKNIGRLCHLGLVRSKEVKLKMSLDRIGSGNVFFNRKHSETSKRKMREAKLGKKQTAEHIKNMKKAVPRGDKHRWWKGGISKDPYYHKWIAKIRRMRMERAGRLTTKILQEVYEENIKKFGTLTCEYCSKDVSFGSDTIDHRLPLARGGTNNKNNLAIACHACNSKKHLLTDDEFVKKQRRTSMPVFNPNPQIEATAAFEVVKPGVYAMRVVQITEFKAKSGNDCLKVEMEYANPSECVKMDGTPANNPGHIFDNGLVTAPAEKQGKLRGFVEACGKTWGEVSDTDELIGSEIQVNVGVEEYEGVQKNVAKRYLK